MEYLRGKNILLISPEAWGHLFVSKHHYAIELGKRGNNVFFLNPPTNSFSVRKTEYDNVSEINHPPFLKGLRFFPSFIQKFFFRKRFDYLQKIFGKKIDCVWSFDNSVFFNFSFLRKDILAISHIVDYSQNFQFQATASTASLCLGVTRNIVDRLAAFNKNSFLIPHGVAMSLSQSAEVELPGTNKVKVLYAGNLNSKYLDKNTLFQLIKNHPSIDFVFLGPGALDWLKSDNLYLVGVIKREFLNNYLEKADILLIIYDFEKHPEQLTNAHKVLEYLGAGKTIVSNYIPDYNNQQDLIEMATSKDEIEKVFTRVLAKLTEYNSEELIEKGKRMPKTIPIPREWKRLIFL